MTSSSTLTVVGGGPAGSKAAEALRDKDFSGHVVLFAAEEHPSAHTVSLPDGTTVSCDKLLPATRSTPDQLAGA